MIKTNNYKVSWNMTIDKHGFKSGRNHEVEIKK